MSGIADPSVDESAIGAINDAAGYCRTLWATFIGYAATIFILASGTTHEALLRQTAVKLPLFNVESGIPLRLFYLIAPLLLVLFHLNLLMKLHDLRVRVRELILPLNYYDDTNAQFLRGRLRRRLMAFDYAMLRAGLVSDRRERWLLSTVTDTTIFVMPILLLLFVQLQFLPYHDWKISWLHRTFIVIDLTLIAYVQLWLGSNRLQAESEPAAAPAASWKKWQALFSFPSFSFKPRLLARGLLFALPIFVSTIVLAYPGEPQDVFWKAAWAITRGGTGELGSPDTYSALAGGDFAEGFGIRRSLYLADRTLWAQDPAEELLQALSDEKTIEALREVSDITDPKLRRVAQRIRDAALTLRGRNLSYANFENARLIAADFSPNLNNEQMRAFDRRNTTGKDMPVNTTDLRGASFSGSDLRGAKLPYVQATRGDFYAANLQSSVLKFGKLQGATFDFAQLQGAALSRADLRAANLQSADLQGADLASVKLQGADLGMAQLQGAILGDAQLQGANLDSAKLQDANFYQAQLQGAILTDAQLQGADLSETGMQGAKLNRAQLQGANLQMAQLQGADLTLAKMQGADLADAQLQGANLGEADLRGADLARVAIKVIDLGNADISLANLSGVNPKGEYDFSKLGLYEQEIPDAARRKDFLTRIAESQKRMSANAPALQGARGDNVWIDDPTLLDAQVKPADHSSPNAYPTAWATFLADLACKRDGENDDAASAAIARTLSARAQALDQERDLALRAKGSALAGALLGNACAKARLSMEQMAGLGAIARRTFPGPPHQ